MTRICNFPISQTKRCTQPISDNKPNCGRHSTELSADQLGQRPVAYKKDNELHVWTEEPDGLYCLIHRDSTYQVLCQLAGETPPYCLYRTAKWTNGRGTLHRDDGPAVIEPDGTQKWYQHGKLHRDDGPAWIEPDRTQRWYQHGDLHRDDGPAIVDANGRQYWYWHGKRHRDDGPAEIFPSGRQTWWWRGEHVTEQEHTRLSTDDTSESLPSASHVKRIASKQPFEEGIH